MYKVHTVSLCANNKLILTLNTFSLFVFLSAEDCKDLRGGATSEGLRVDAPGSSHMSGHSGELRILSVHGKGEGPLALDGHDTLFAASEPEAPSSLSGDHSGVKILDCSVRLVHHEELTGHRGGRKGQPRVLLGKGLPDNTKTTFLKRTHKGEKPYGCDQCKKRFPSKGTLANHMRTHTGEKPFKCDQCMKSYQQKSYLKIHMRTHSGEKPFKCDQCKKCFSQSSNLKLHMKITGRCPVCVCSATPASATRAICVCTCSSTRAME